MAGLTCGACKRSGFKKPGSLATHYQHCKEMKKLMKKQLRTLEKGKQRETEQNLRDRLTRPRVLLKRHPQPRKEVPERVEREDSVEEREFVQGSSRDSDRVEMTPDDIIPSAEPPEEVPISRSRAGRARKPPKTLRDFVPSARHHMGLPQHIRPRNPSPSPPSPSPSTGSYGGSQPPHDVPMDVDPADEVPSVYTTIPDKFGVYRRYTICPKTDPNELLPPDAHVDIPGSSKSTRKESTRAPRGFEKHSGAEPDNIFVPFANETQFRFANWQCSGTTTKSIAEAQRLKDEVIDHPSFNKDDLKDFNVSRALAELDEADLTDDLFTADDGWYKGSVTIQVPMEKVAFDSEADAIQFKVENIHHRKLLEVVKEAFEDSSSETFHYIPFKEYWTSQATRNNSGLNDNPPSLDEAERMFSEIYNSDAMLEEDAKLRAQPREPEDDPDTEYAIAALLPYSDSTRLANFGTASLWPIYLFFGNQSKYFRGKPSCFSAHHLAYLPNLPDDFQDFYRRNFDGNSASDETLRFCKRELMQLIWLLLLDDEFMHAYEHGILIRCGDGQIRRIFPRFFCYSADYPEKVLIACIRYFAQCPCPCCLVKKEDISALGTTIDYQRRNHVRADNEHIHHLIQLSRQWIYEGGFSIRSARIKRLLDSMSLVPTRSAFSTRLHPFGVNFYSLLAPDLMHDFELGTWPDTLKHTLRILYAAGGNCIQEFNERFRQVHPFGRNTIRRFNSNVSALKGIAARDYEDILQCIIPVLEGLLDEPHDTILREFVFTLATWHALAKLRLHTERTLTFFEDTTRLLGAEVRRFEKTICQHYHTTELPKETAARGRREAALAAKGKTSNVTGERAAKKRKHFNPRTYKWHSLPDYPRAIRMFGTTDNTSTQPGEGEHRRVKRFWLYDVRSV